MLITKLLSLSIALLLVSTVVQAGEAEHQILKDIEELGELDVDDPDALQEAAAKIYLQCAALFNAMSIAVSDTRPALSKLQQERKNWFQLVGQILLTEPGDKVGSTSTRADAYVETYMLDRVLHYSEADMEIKLDVCASESLQAHGRKIISDQED